ncbi:MAG: hypothetical protein J0I43_10825 [Microbacterium sp.]|uniref:hypothetical protein n=1 Tax=Microbacterium sp. TaxID=51671 RepID=UPI001AD3212D|nr:hypothetical protein [Microbacterium sp.]MBN9177848.1 hypothetical protein [Microbacterium sp.]
MSKQRIAIGIAAFATAALLLTGCTTTTQGTYEGSSNQTTAKLAGSLTELFQQALDGEKNPFVIEVLNRAIATGKISQADYDEAHRLYRVCMSDAGYEETYTQLANGSYQITPPRLDGDSAVEKYMDVGTECSAELAPIEALFITQQGNPDLIVDQEQLAVQCLNKAGLVDASYTASNFRSDLDNAFKDATFDPMSSEAQTCFSNAGYTITVGKQ